MVTERDESSQEIDGHLVCIRNSEDRDRGGY